MNNIKTLVLSRESVLTAALVGAAVMAPLLHSQLVTGAIVNAALFGAVILVGFRAAAVVALAPSLIALAAGTLPAAMAAMVPFVMASNIALAGVFSILRKTNYLVAAAEAGLVKFGFLVVLANVILSATTHGNVAVVLASAMGWAQLITVVFGALLAYMVFERKTV